MDASRRWFVVPGDPFQRSQFRHSPGFPRCPAMDQPVPTVTTAHRGEQALVTAHLIDMGHGESHVAPALVAGATGCGRWKRP